MMALNAAAEDRSEALAPAFIQATEVWIPDEAGNTLVRSAGMYGALGAFGTASEGESFAKGEGLPGLAWAEARPIILRDIQNDGIFRRAEAARTAGLSAAAAIPVFAGEALKGVLVMLCAEDEGRIGAIEVWSSDESPGTPMRLVDGFYGAAKHFQWVSERTEFPRGQGLPGGVWASRTPMLFRDLGRSYGFIRAESAGKAGLTTGLGLPVPTPSADSYVLTLLSARDTPIARRFELWDVVPGRGGLPAHAVLVDGLCETEGALWGTERKATAWQGAVGRAFGGGVPVAESVPAKPDGLGHSAMIALPIHDADGVAHVAAWFV